MKTLDALKILTNLQLKSIRTCDVAGILKIPIAHASKLLSRLSESGQIISIKRGTWVFTKNQDPYSLPPYLTSPFPSYLSLQTALYLHGMISQIPHVIYAVSLARTRRYVTPLGEVSIHHFDPSFFFGYEEVEGDSYFLATPEKALIDFLYLFPVKSKHFRMLPELNLSENFSMKKARRIITQIPSKRLQSIVLERLELFENQIK